MADINEAITRGELYALASRLATSLADAHTTIRSPASSSALQVRFRWVSDGLTISGVDDETLPLQVGDEVVGIGNLQPSDLERAMRGLVSSENAHWVRILGAMSLHEEGFLRALGAVAANDTVLLHARNSSGGLVSHAPPLRPYSSEQRDDTKWFGWEIHPEADYGYFYLDRCDNAPEYRAAVDEFFRAGQRCRTRRDRRPTQPGREFSGDRCVPQVPAGRVGPVVLG